MRGKVAIVTGGAAGIGRGICAVLGRRGSRVVVADIDAGRAEETAAELRAGAIEAIGMRVDAASADDAQRMVDNTTAHLGRLDVLVNNAGIVLNAPSLEVTPAQWQSVFEVNVNGVFFCSQAAARWMIAHEGGSIVNIASTTAHVASPGYVAYCASKGAVVSLTRALAVEWSPHDVRVNSVSPGSIDTSLSEQMRMLDPQRFEKRRRRVPIRRAGTVEDIANAVAFLVSEESGYISGCDLLVDGGMLAQHPGFVD